MKILKKFRITSPLKFLAIILFAILLFFGFYLGLKYKELKYTISNTPQVQNQITKAQAENIVKNLPEVKTILKNTEVEHLVEALDRNQIWTVRVANIVKDYVNGAYIDHHLSTLNWYYVDKQTGKIICSMYVYDKNGEYKKEINNCNDL